MRGALTSPAVSNAAAPVATSGAVLVGADGKTVAIPAAQTPTDLKAKP